MRKIDPGFDGPLAGRAVRRDLLATAAATFLIAALAGPHARAWARPEPMEAWARRLVGLKDDLQAGRIGVLDWQARVEALNRSVPLEKLGAYLDIGALTAGFSYPTLLAEVADAVLPPDIVGDGGMRRWFARVFGLRRGGAIIPHVHNNMVSAHLVISGAFRVRTHDRVGDLADAVVLRQTRDAQIRPGDVISMSDRRDNQHWLVALEDRSMTFDVGIVDLPPSWEYGLAANNYNMIFVDPDRPPERDGTIVAPVLTFVQAQAKFAA
jgi:hypothetical protein